ncbi:MAG: UDP-N-acetylmuramate dehydrogenase [Patescibacteria group bacterium]|nr:UDP-N-acetylmuramate dehydrogenase [Patescibacteria group bacterium]
MSNQVQNPKSQNFKNLFPRIKKNVLLKNYTTFKIGGPAKYFFVAKSKRDLIGAVKWAKERNLRDFEQISEEAQGRRILRPVGKQGAKRLPETEGFWGAERSEPKASAPPFQRKGGEERSDKLPFFILGGGSNLLVSDKGFKGIVIKIKNQKSKIKNTNQKSKVIEVGAGTELSDLVDFSFKEGLQGLEWAAGIPGTVGGAIYGNAAAFGSSIGEIVKEVEVFDAIDSEIKKFNSKGCNFSLKETIFKKNKNLIILSAILQLRKGNQKKIKKEINYFLNYRQKNHPLKFPSAGCVFKNVKLKMKNEKLQFKIKNFSEIRKFKKNGIIPVGFLIEKCGLKGKRIGGAQISKKHANFIVNRGKAKSGDVLKLINLIKRKVKNKFSVSLEEEIQHLGG